MITKIKIENFKSIDSLELELGRLNVFIGANGSGKSNILEGIAFGSAAIEYKLDDEFLGNRGFRVTEPHLLKSRFKKQNLKKEIQITWSNNSVHDWRISAQRSNQFYGKWSIKGSIKDFSEYRKELVKDLVIKQFKNKTIKKEINKALKNTEDSRQKKIIAALSDIFEIIEDEKLSTEDIFDKMPPIYDKQVEDDTEKLAQDFLNFMIYAPETSFLRRFDGEAQIKPLGFKGDGLFKLLTVLAQEKQEIIDEINKHLYLIEWFDGFEIPKDLKYTEKRINFKDSFLQGSLKSFDQKSANEGALFLLFYLTLFIGKYTPKFFAIDNIDNALNPKLGSQLIKILAQLAKDHDKQVILTTHNPAILDGLNLNDEMQRLFVISRNADGHTKALRIKKEPVENGKPNVKLSEQFLRGYIGGLNF